MLKSIVLIICGVLLIIVGIFNVMGDISSVHSYNRRKVQEKGRKKYGLFIGLGTIAIGASLIITSILELIFTNSLLDIIILVGCGIGLALILIGQFKYNKGIF